MFFMFLSTFLLPHFFSKFSPTYLVYFETLVGMFIVEFITIELCLAAAKSAAFLSAPQYYGATTCNQFRQAHMAARKSAGF